MILSTKQRVRSVPRFLVAVAFALVITTAVVIAGAVQTRQLTLAEVQGFAKVASQKAGIPIDGNPLVLEQINKFIGTPDGRKRTMEAFERLPMYEPMIVETFKKYGVPVELVSMAIYESGMRNDLTSSMKARGIWQFIPATARRYQLVVTDSIDERVDPVKETRAAAEYLRDLHRQFGDWRLAVQAYNQGERKVARMIQQRGTRDPWELEKADGSENYLSGAVASMVLYHNRQLFQ